MLDVSSEQQPIYTLSQLGVRIAAYKSLQKSSLKNSKWSKKVMKALKSLSKKLTKQKLQPEADILPSILRTLNTFFDIEGRQKKGQVIVNNNPLKEDETAAFLKNCANLYESYRIIFEVVGPIYRQFPPQEKQEETEGFSIQPAYAQESISLSPQSSRRRLPLTRPALTGRTGYEQFAVIYKLLESKEFGCAGETKDSNLNQLKTILKKAF